MRPFKGRSWRFTRQGAHGRDGSHRLGPCRARTMCQDARMSRIALPGTNTPGDPASLDVVRALGLVRPELAKAVGALDAAVTASPLDPRVHELVRMRVAQINACTVCLAWRIPEATAAGIDDELLENVHRY